MQNNRAHGFTLVEMLIAISILAIIAVLGWRGLDSMVRSRTALAEAARQTRNLQRTFAQLQDDCAHLADPAAMGERPPLGVAPGQLVLVREVFAEREPSRVRVVVYRLRNGVLTRRESLATRDLATLDRLLQGARANADSAQDVPLQPGIGALGIRTWANGWGENAQPRVPPTGLEVTLQLARDGNSVQRVFLLGPA